MPPRQQASTLDYTVSAEMVQGLIDCAVRCGVAKTGIASLLRQPGGSKSASMPPARYSAQFLFALWERFVHLSGDPVIGFRMALFTNPSTFGAASQILPRCATVREAFRQVERFWTLVAQYARISVKCNASALTISIAADLPKGIVAQNVMLCGLTNLALLPERLAGHDGTRPNVVECAFPSPGAAAAAAVRQRLPFKFDAPANRVVFHRRVGEMRVASADEGLRLLLAQVMERDLDELGPPGGFERGLTTILHGMMNGTMPTLAALSAHVGLSQRTLQRRLARSNTSFQRLLQQVLHEAAEEYLARGTFTQGEIAFLLGYSEVSAFSHAYRSWTGHSPGAAHIRPTIRH
jgi:AraC-like DNA-binding protein